MTVVKCPMCKKMIGKEEGDHVTEPTYIISVQDATDGLINAKALLSAVVHADCYEVRLFGIPPFLTRGRINDAKPICDQLDKDFGDCPYFVIDTEGKWCGRDYIDKFKCPLNAKPMPEEEKK